MQPHLSQKWALPDLDLDIFTLDGQIVGCFKVQLWVSKYSGFCLPYLAGFTTHVLPILIARENMFSQMHQGIARCTPIAEPRAHSRR